jgi:CDP-glucose 4,6-dehydratase
MESLVMQDHFSYYKGKKVFVTGHTGFKGSWLMACLYKAGARIKGYALEPEYEGLFSLLEPLNIGESIIADIRDKAKLEKEIISFQPDFIFHLAAQPLVRRSYMIPAETIEINVVGTANLLESVMKIPSKCTVVVVTTDKVYENKEKDILYKEDDKLGGYDPYSASKACTELVVDCFRKSFFNKNNYDNHHKAIATARAGNVIGGGDRSSDRLVPDIIHFLETNQPVPVRNPNAVRPWQHVLEPVSGYLKLGVMANEDAARFSKAFNFGPLPGDHLSVKELVETAISCWGQGNWKDISDPSQPHEAGLLKLDINLAINELQWKPKLPAGEAIKWTIEWFRKPVSEQRECTFDQIKEYFE